MLEILQNIDLSVFLFINMKLANPVTDFIMPVITYSNGIRSFYGIALVMLLWKGDNRLRWMVLVSAIVLLFTDQSTANFMKKWIARPRPCHTLCPILNGYNLLVGCGGGYSMPSTHAANAFGQASLFAFHYKKIRWYLFGYASLIALSRVFVGVHYPSDIIVGSTVGFLIGTSLAFGFGKIYKR